MEDILQYDLCRVENVVVLHVTHQNPDFTIWLKQNPRKHDDLIIHSAMKPELLKGRVYLRGKDADTTATYELEDPLGAAEYAKKAREAIDATVATYRKVQSVEHAKQALDNLDPQELRALLTEYGSKPYFKGKMGYGEFAASLAKFAEHAPQFDCGVMVSEEGQLFFAFGLENDSKYPWMEALGTSVLAKKDTTRQALTTKLYLCTS